MAEMTIEKVLLYFIDDSVLKLFNKGRKMKKLKFVVTIIMLLSVMSIFCDEPNEHSESREGNSEETGDEFTLTENCDIIRNGMHLILKYDAKNNIFIGTVENITPKKLEKVRVEVHLSTGTELGPTPNTDLEPGAEAAIKITTTQKDFISWSAHPEVGNSEHVNSESHDESNEHESKESHEKREGREKH